MVSVPDLLLAAPETWLKLFLKTSGAETWLVQCRGRGRALLPMAQHHHGTRDGPKRLLGDAAAG